MGMLAELEKHEREKVKDKSEFYHDLQIYRGGRLNDSKPTVKIWQGNRAKPIANYYFRTEEQRERFIQVQKDNADARIKYKEEKQVQKQAAKAKFQNPFRIGDIIHHSWGYDQTQCDYYQVVGLTRATVTLRPIASEYAGATGPMAQNEMPVKDAFVEAFTGAMTKDHNGKVKEFTKRVSYYMQDNGELRYYIPTEHGWADKWDGSPKYHSWYA